MTPRSKAPAGLAGGWAPAGSLLADARWRPRHRAVLWVLWFHLSVMWLVAIAAGHNLGQAALVLGLLGLGAAAASIPAFSRCVRTLLAVVALLSCSAWLVHVTGGPPESHFHLFAVLGLTLLYQEWRPFALAVAYVAAYYGLFGMLFPAEVYSGWAQDRPVMWAFVYAGLMFLASLAGLAGWWLAEAERKNVERRGSERRLAAAEHVAGMGSWEWDTASSKVMWSPGMYRLFGRETGNGEETLASWLAMIHPEDRQMAMDRAEEALAGGTGFDITYRAFRADSRELVLHSRGEIIANEHGSGTSMLGTVLDITDRHAASEALRKSEELARSVIGTAGDAYIQFGSDGLVTEWNGQAEAIFGWTHAEVLGRPLSPLILAAGSRELFERRVGLSGGPSPHGRFELSMLHRSGDEIPVEVTAWTIPAGGATVFSCFIRDVRERQAVQRAKDEFLSVVGHELRTPLTSIHGALGLLRGGLLGELNDRGKQMVGIAAHNTDRLVRLINDILDIERLNSGKLPLERQECDIAVLGQRSVEAMRPMAEAAGVSLEIDAQPGTVWIDPDRIEQTLTNLLSNAIKFSPAGAAVWLTARTDGDEVEVQVRDQGRGIPHQHLELIFDRFQQVDGSDSREKGGTGLGLAICRTIVQQHGGRIWAESGPGGGSTLTLRLPVIPPYDSLAKDGGPTVLVCGNDPSRRDTVAAMLSPHGYATIDVPSGAGLLEAAITHRPALILLELRMPAADGWQTAAALRDHTATRDIPMVFLNLDDNAAPTGPQAPDGPYSPVGPGGLFAAIERALSSRAAGPTLLLVEDDEGLAQVLTERFRNLGIEVHHAPTARRALAMCANLVPDLLVLDLLLPDQDGYAVVAQLRRDARLRGMPLAVYTACDLSEADRKRLRLGQTEFFTKSRVSPDEFERHVVDLFGHLTKTEEEPTHA